MGNSIKKLATVILTTISCTLVFTACSFRFDFFKKDSQACTHVYDNACDVACNECDEAREVAGHVYDNACDMVCNECEEFRSIQHDYSVLQSNETYHWYICSGCEREDGENKARHTGGEATCQEQAECEVCEVAYGEVNAENHTGQATHKFFDMELTECTYDCCGAVENHYQSFIDTNCYCEECEEVAHLLDEYCQCYDCREIFHELDETCFCVTCSWHFHSAVDAETGICVDCNQFGAAASVVENNVKVYYTTLDDAISVANGKDCTIIIENNHLGQGTPAKITSGNIVVDLNGKIVSSTSNTALYVKGAMVTVCDSVGGGEMLKRIFVTDGNLIVESGKYNSVTPWDGVTVKVYGGEIGSIAKTDTEIVKLYGGSFELVNVLARVGTLADLLPVGYCFYDESGNEIDLSTVELDGVYYRLNNVTVGCVELEEEEEEFGGFGDLF